MSRRRVAGEQRQPSPRDIRLWEPTWKLSLFLIASSILQVITWTTPEFRGNPYWQISSVVLGLLMLVPAATLGKQLVNRKGWARHRTTTAADEFVRTRRAGRRQPRSGD